MALPRPRWGCPAPRHSASSRAGPERSWGQLTPRTLVKIARSSPSVPQPCAELGSREERRPTRRAGDRRRADTPPPPGVLLPGLGAQPGPRPPPIATSPELQSHAVPARGF
uniref:Uncharacterized protein n=1 Tax=Mustela putorius furo TaxID=9669 RepID=M3YNX3_MUSPF